MKRFLFVACTLLMLCITTQSFCTPKTTPNNDVGFSCVNQTFTPSTVIDYNIYLLSAVTQIAANADLQSASPKLFTVNVENVGATLMAAQGNNINLLPPKLIQPYNYSIKTNQTIQGIYRLDIGEINTIRVNVLPYQTNVTTYNKTFDLTTSANNMLINPVPLL